MQTEKLLSDVVAFVVDVSRTRWTADDKVQCERLSFILDCFRSSLLLHGHLTHGQPFSVYHIDVLGCVHRLINAVADGDQLLSTLHSRLTLPLRAHVPEEQQGYTGPSVASSSQSPPSPHSLPRRRLPQSCPSPPSLP